MLAVAQADASGLFWLAHRRWALAEGVTDAELAALKNQDPERFDRRTWAAIAWADARARAFARAGAGGVRGRARALLQCGRAR